LSPTNAAFRLLIKQNSINDVAAQVFQSGCSSPQLTPDRVEEEVGALIVHFNKQYSINGVTEAEHVEIVRAIACLTRGHWFKCPNGHFYCIGECGSATEIAKCPECGARIGGTGHQLLEDNCLAPEMDGACSTSCMVIQWLQVTWLIMTQTNFGTVLACEIC